MTLKNYNDAFFTKTEETENNSRLYPSVYSAEYVCTLQGEPVSSDDEDAGFVPLTPEQLDTGRHQRSIAHTFKCIEYRFYYGNNWHCKNIIILNS